MNGENEPKVPTVGESLVRTTVIGLVSMFATKVVIEVVDAVGGPENLFEPLFSNNQAPIAVGLSAVIVTAANG